MEQTENNFKNAMMTSIFFVLIETECSNNKKFRQTVAQEACRWWTGNYYPICSGLILFSIFYNVEQIIYSNIRWIVCALGKALTGLGIPSLGECGEEWLSNIGMLLFWRWHMGYLIFDYYTNTSLHY